jgi:replicative DNA helicase
MALNEETWCMETRRVLRAFATGRRPVFKLATRLGRTIRATGNHKFRAFDGWRRLDDMAPGIRIALPLGMSSPLRHERPTIAAEAHGGVAQLISRSETITTTGEICWDEIIQLEPDGQEETYDLTVEGLHNFVANDLVVHNSIEQDADLVFFIYRDEYYNEESDQQGLAEVILAKHRNGPTGSEKLSFLKRYAKFADLAA